MREVFLSSQIQVQRKYMYIPKLPGIRKVFIPVWVAYAGPWCMLSDVEGVVVQEDHAGTIVFAISACNQRTTEDAL